VEYRVEELAAACGVSVDTVRYYQSRHLLPPPDKQGRVAVYGRAHAARIREIRSLQRKGLTLAVIRRHLEGKLGDASLAGAVAAAAGDPEPDRPLTLAELAARTGVPASLLTAARKAGLLLGRTAKGKERFSATDVEVVRLGMRLLDAGLPPADVLALATEYDAAARAIARRAVAMFDDHVRAPIRSSGIAESEATEQLVSLFSELLPAVTDLVSQHFRRVLLTVAEEHIAQSDRTTPARAKRSASRRRA